ncbi:hypothetical protein MKX01_031925 [Papaver californicum]|nr:hypothetical protein MKX01_031925 [Papaver californicum]
MFTPVSVVILMGLIAYAYQAIQPPPPKICGTSDGPPAAPRVKLSDGRNLAYKEHGVPIDEAKYKIVFIHGFGSYRLTTIRLSQSDPNPKRTDKGISLDVEELADQLGVGSKFYVLAFSMGGQATWGCLKYIPHRLAGAALVAPVINYWWPGFPANFSNEACEKQLLQDQWTLRVCHYASFLTYCVAAKSRAILSAQDREILSKISKVDMAPVTQQGQFESLHRDLNVGFGNPFTSAEGTVHLWHGDEDLFVPISLQRYIAENKLSWIQYHELASSGHLFLYADGMNDTIIKALVLGEKKRGIRASTMVRLLPKTKK